MIISSSDHCLCRNTWTDSEIAHSWESIARGRCVQQACSPVLTVTGYWSITVAISEASSMGYQPKFEVWLSLYASLPVHVWPQHIKPYTIKRKVRTTTGTWFLTNYQLNITLKMSMVWVLLSFSCFLIKLVEQFVLQLIQASELVEIIAESLHTKKQVSNNNKKVLPSLRSYIPKTNINRNETYLENFILFIPPHLKIVLVWEYPNICMQCNQSKIWNLSTCQLPQLLCQ